jgi:predicted secreted acid phosphatase
MTDKLAGRIKVDGNNSDEAYYKGWPGKCPYNDDLNWAAKLAIQYLEKISPRYKGTGKIGLVIFDLDDTIFMGDPAQVIGIVEMSLGMHKGPNGEEQEIFILPVNRQIVKVANVARQLGFKIVCLTARPQESQLASVTNLNMFSVPNDMLLMNNKDEDPFFKIRVRRQLSSTPNQDIVLTIGDQFTDLYFPGSAAAIKLPDPESKVSYAYFP